MRGSLAKKLRRIAEHRTVGLPELVYSTSNVKRYKASPNRPAVQTSAITMGKCTRKLYKLLKRGIVTVDAGVSNV